MNFIVKLFKYSWQGLNFIRNAVMNLVFLLFVLFLFSIAGLVMQWQKGVTQPLTGHQGALKLNLDGYLADNRDEQMNWRRMLKELNEQHVPEQISTFDVVYAIEFAASDDRISGLVLDLNSFEGGDLPAIEYIGKSIQKFKASKKPVIAFADNYSQIQYLLASYADEIYLNPMGEVSIQGLASENVYFKSMLEKLEVTAHIFRVGTYKSAVEPFLRDDMSPEAKENTLQWLTQMWGNYQTIVATNRAIEKSQVLPEATKYLAELKALRGDNTAYAQQRKLITQTASRFELEQQLIKHFGKNTENNFKSVKFDDYLANLPERLTTDSAQKIAVVNVEGTIIDGESEQSSVGGDTVAKLLRRALNDQQILSVILRVNSPGGSAFASEIIRQEVDNLQKAGKPVVVSMGNMAASGGYWIASTADYIVADHNTITGSIGIFALFPTFENTLKKVGISADGVYTSPLSQFSGARELPSELNDMLQMNIENGYDKFLSLVSQGRKLTKAQVDQIAQGRIWLGEDAYKHKLVDELGDFDTALKKAAQLVEQKGIKVIDVGVEWLVDEEHNGFATMFKNIESHLKVILHSSLFNWLGLSQHTQIALTSKLGELNQFNDPKGQYIYCLMCGTIK